VALAIEREQRHGIAQSVTVENELSTEPHRPERQPPEIERFWLERDHDLVEGALREQDHDRSIGYEL
jgi:hypothetical protein